MSNTTPTPAVDTKQFTAAALDAELGRRRNNRKRVARGDDKVRAASFVLPALSADNIAAIKAGETVRVEFNSGRIVNVSLKGA